MQTASFLRALTFASERGAVDGSNNLTLCTRASLQSTTLSIKDHPAWTTLQRLRSGVLGRPDAHRHNEYALLHEDGSPQPLFPATVARQRQPSPPLNLSLLLTGMLRQTRAPRANGHDQYMPRIDRTRSTTKSPRSKPPLPDKTPMFLWLLDHS